MKKRLASLLCAAVLAAGILSGCGSSQGETADRVTQQGEEEGTKDSVVVTMPVTAEPESGFDPAYGWGAGEHVHEPLIQSTLTVTTTDLKIDKPELFTTLPRMWLKAT